MSCTTTPTIVLWPVATALACRFAVYPRSAAAWWTRSASGWPTCRRPLLSTRDAVVSDTPARSATSCRVTPDRGLVRSGGAWTPWSWITGPPRLDPYRGPAYAGKALSETVRIVPRGRATRQSRGLKSMTRKVIQVAVNGVTGRMGYRQHLVRSLLAIREQGGVRLEDSTTLYPEPILVGRDEERLRAIAGRRAAAGPRGQGRGDHPRGGARQAVPARRAEAAAADPRGLLWPGALGPAGVWLLGVRGRRDLGPATVLELPRGRRRRDRARHVPALAVPADRPVRPDQRAVLEEHH